ncbi:MAG: hypothetical protein GW809_02245 [Bacteroidetes bacterium]|nr:hypothetical protein [Bacteroidota bacterium]NCQ10972.1 hypothetical protein [Bacteroidota bacterium]
MKKVLLARPSLFIVNDMRHLLIDSSYVPTPIKHLNELQLQDFSKVGGAVISTALSSEVAEDYAQVAKAIKDIDISTPIMMATLVPFEHLIKALTIKFSTNGMNMNFYSIQIASRKLSLNPTTDVLVIHKDDITSQEMYAITKKTFNNFFR